jgi:hypothetical protein
MMKYANKIFEVLLELILSHTNADRITNEGFSVVDDEIENKSHDIILELAALQY